MIANAVLRWLGYSVEPRVDAVMAQRYLNPEVLAKALEQAPKSKQAQIIHEMMRQYGQSSAIGATTVPTATALGEQ
jgi:hypothetical protein